MNWVELRARIAKWEDLHTEFKEWLPHKDDVAASLVAFANTDGGQLVIGVTKERLIKGVDDADAVARLVDDVATNNCEPPITVIQEVLWPDNHGPGAETTLTARPVLVVNIPKGDQRPYRTNRGVFYIRTTSGRRSASREELLRLFQATESLYYDETPLHRLSLSDFDFDSLDRYLEATGQRQLHGDPERLLTNWGLYRNGHPTIAGLVLFGREPQRHLPFAQINAARFPGRDSSLEPSDRKDLTGRLLDVIDQAERFLDLHLRVPHEIRGFEPEPKPELPKEALREAIVNAVAHRDYTIHGPVRLFVFDDRVEVHTPGKPPNTVDEGAMRAGTHVVRNPRIYARLSDAGLVTRAGTGIPRIIRLVKQATGRDIEINVREFEVLLTIPRTRADSAP
ncbi:MAG: putative DNA binding domain-containing protein [Acetobacteraceae bacterium]|nr:putative DNA binding domain-containing protein [Acetobacteraceae bacterium]